MATIREILKEAKLTTLYEKKAIEVFKNNPQYSDRFKAGGIFSEAEVAGNKEELAEYLLRILYYDDDVKTKSDQISEPPYFTVILVGIALCIGAAIYANAVGWGSEGIGYLIVGLPILILGAAFVYYGLLLKKNYKKGKEVSDLDTSNTKLHWFAIAFIVIFLGIVLVGCVRFLSNLDTGPDYETYYIDENGNGKLDQGERNYTQDENGRIVDTDPNGNNFEFD